MRRDTPNTISGTVWNDVDADGTLDGDEPDGYEGVTIVLLDPEGNVVATTETGPNGDYEFPGLPDGDYTVVVSDEEHVLVGHWHTEGPNPGDDNNSQTLSYPVSVTGGEENDTGDFGFYEGRSGGG